jgi:hypothetical protein
LHNAPTSQRENTYVCIQRALDEYLTYLCVDLTTRGAQILKIIELNVGKVTSSTLRNSSVILDLLCVNILKIEKIFPKLLRYEKA